MNVNQKWLEKQAKLKIEQDAQALKVFDSFDEYVQAFPEAEKWRNWVENGSLIPTYHSCLPGPYYVATIKQWPSLVDKKRNGPLETWLLLNDGDDGMCSKKCQNIEEAQNELTMIKLLAPFHLWDLQEFGFKF